MDVVTHLLEHEGQIVGRGIGGTHPGDIDGPGLMQDLLGAGKGIPQLGGVQGLQQADVVLDGPLKGIRSGVLGRGLPAEQGFQLAEGGPLLLVLIEPALKVRIALKIQPAGKAGDGGRTDPGPLAELIDGEKGHLVEIFQNKISQPPVAFGKRIVVGADLGDNIFCLFHSTVSLFTIIKWRTWGGKAQPRQNHYRRKPPERKLFFNILVLR